MAKSIFLSCSDEDKKLGEAISVYLQELYPGMLEIYMFSQALSTTWQNDTKYAMKNSDSIISLMTPAFRNKPWAYIELTPFWLEDKHVTVLCLENKLSLHSLPLFQRYNYYNLKIEGDIARFLQGVGHHVLGKDKESTKISVDTVKDFMDKLADSMDQVDLQSLLYEEYSEFLLMRQYEHQDYESFFDTLNNIEDDQIIKNIALILSSKGDIERTIEVLRRVNDLKYIRQFAVTVYKRALGPANLMSEVLKLMKGDQSQLRNFAKYLINAQKEKSALFNDTINHMFNNAEIRNVCLHLISVRGLTADCLPVINSMNNQAEIKNLLIGAIRMDQHQQPEFKRVLDSMTNEKHKKTVLNELGKNNNL